MSKNLHLINVVRRDGNEYEYVETKVIELNDRVDSDEPSLTVSTHTINVMHATATENDDGSIKLEINGTAQENLDRIEEALRGGKDE